MNFRIVADHYAVKGFSVLPCSKDKRPLIASWAKLQKRQPTATELDEWGEAHPEANIALVCGRLSDLTVVDCDMPEAIATVEALLPDSLEVPTTNTPRGGRHYYFCFTPDLYSRNGTAKDIDVKAEGGYILVPPSRTDKGDYAAGSIDIDKRTVMPEALLGFLKKGQAAAPDSQGQLLTQGRRDEDLFHMALQLFKDGHPREEVERIVLAAGKVATPPFPERATRAKIESASKRMQRNGAAEDEEATLAEREASKVKVRPIPWLWHGVIATHMATAITGDCGDGKSLVAVDITARVTRGKAFPVYGRVTPPVKGHVFYVTSEGVPEMILVPRLMAAGADLAKVTIIEGLQLKNGDFSVLDITRDLSKIERRARDFPDLKLIVVDPIASFLPERINPSQQNQVRQAMDQISNLAYKLGIANLPVMHFAKAINVKASYKTSGSVQFMASVKMSWSVVHRPNDPRNTRLLVPQKSNISGAHESLSFSIHEVKFPVPDDPKTIIETVKIEYGNLVDEDPETLISPPIESDSHVADAIRFLTQKLREGTTLYAAQLINEAEEHGIPKWALYKAKDRMGIAHDKEGHYQGRTFWFMPQEQIR